MFNLYSLVVVQMSFCLIELCSKPLSLEIARIAFGSLLADSRFWRCKVTTVFGLIPNFFSLFLSKTMDKEPLYGQIGEIGLIPVHKRVSTGQNLSQRGQSLLWHTPFLSPCVKAGRCPISCWAATRQRSANGNWIRQWSAPAASGQTCSTSKMTNDYRD